MPATSTPLLGLLPIEVHGTQFRNTIRYALRKRLHFTALLPHILNNLLQIKKSVLKLSSQSSNSLEADYLSSLQALHTCRLWIQFLIQVHKESTKITDLAFSDHQKIHPLYQVMREIQDLIDPLFPLVLQKKKEGWTDLLTTVQTSIQTMQKQTERVAQRIGLVYRMSNPATHKVAQELVHRFFANFMSLSAPITQFIQTHLEEWLSLSLKEGRDLLIPKPESLPCSFLFSANGHCYPLMESVEHLLGKGADKIVFRIISLPSGSIKAVMKPNPVQELIDTENKSRKNRSQLFNMWTESELLLKLKKTSGVIQIEERMVFEIEDKKQLFLIEDYYWDGSFHDYFFYTLKRKHSGGQLTPRQIKDVMQQTLQGLAGIHQAGIVHHDIKPDNILFDLSEETIKTAIADFQLAAYEHDLSRLDYLRCRAAWAPPEYAQLKLIEDSKKRFSSLASKPIDIWSLGVIFYLFSTHSLPPWFHSSKSKPGKTSPTANPPPKKSPNSKEENPEKALDVVSLSKEEERHTFELVAALTPDWLPEKAKASSYFPLLQRMLDIHPTTRCSAEEALDILHSLIG